MPPQRSRKPKRAKKRAAARKIVEPTRRQSISLGEKLVLQAIAWGEPLLKRLESLVRVIEGQSREILCSILLLDEDGKTLRYGAAPSLPESYNRAIDGLAIGPSVGSCGTAAYRKEIVVVRNIATDPLWANCRDLPLSHGLRACWSSPIVSSDGKVLGTFAMYYRRPRSPNAKELELIQFASHLAGIAIIKSRADEAAMANTQAALAAEAKYRGLVETAPDAIISVDREGRMVFVNSQTEKMFGYSRDELLGKAVEMLVPERFRDRHVGHRTDYTSNPRTRLMGVWFDIRGRRKDGSEIPVDIALSPVETDGGLLVTAIIRDISDRKQAEETLRASYEELQALHEIGQTVLTSLDLKSILEGILDKALSIGSFDIGVIRLLDPSSRTLKAAISRGYQHPENIREIGANAGTVRIGAIQGKVLTSKGPIAVENLPSSPGMGTFKKEGVQSAIVVPVRAEEKVLGTIQLGSRTPRKFHPHEIRLFETVGSNLGIAVQKTHLYEEMKKLASDLTKSNKVKDEFLSVMSHELRTPLNVVVGYTGMMKDRLLGEIKPQQEEALGKVISRANDQLAIVNNILHATVLEAEEINIESHEVSLGDFFSQLRSGYGAPINKELTLNWDYPSHLPAIKTDSGKLKQILQNLIDNAMKFTDKGSITISARIKDAGKQVEFKVADTGVGIPKEALPFIFEKFRQVDSSETRLFGGVGMGLYIVKKFTELLGGTVEVDTEPGKGSTFTVTLPLPPG